MYIRCFQQIKYSEILLEHPYFKERLDCVFVLNHAAEYFKYSSKLFEVLKEKQKLGQVFMS